MAIHIAMPGSCGELVQGIVDGINVHISCPINRFAKVSASITGNGSIKTPVGLDKTRTAAKKILEIIGTRYGVEIGIESSLPHGKGMASSTADITATVVAIADLFELKISAKEIASIALSIEPTDGTFFDGVVAFDHLEGRVIERIGESPPIEIIVLEPNESIDTVSFNVKKQDKAHPEEILIKEAFEMAVQGIKGKELRLIGEAATISSILNQKILAKPALNDVVDVCRQKGGLGVNVAHSGTVMGILVERGFGNRLLEKISHYIPRHWNAYVVDMVDGGPQQLLLTGERVNR